MIPFAAPDWVDDTGGAGPIELTAEQQAALRSLTAWTAEGRFRVALLHGVTGSGKTAVYLQLAGHVHAGRGRRVLVLVPEIALTPAVVGAFHAACGGPRWRSSTADCPPASGTTSGTVSAAGMLT